MTSVNLSFDEWEGRKNVGRSIPNASVEEVLAAVESPDGRKKDSMVVEINDGHYLAIGGGGDDRFVLSIIDGSNTHSLVGDADARGEESIKIGGQPVPYEASLVVTRDDVRAAVTHYLSNGSPCSSLRWKSEEN